MASEWSWDDTELGPWKDGVAFVYVKGRRQEDNAKKVIIGAWDGTRYYNRFDININKRLHQLYHAELHGIEGT